MTGVAGMDARSTHEGYGSVAAALHWISAGVVLLLLPFGYAFPPRMGHRVFSWSIAALTLGHIGGVVVHQWTKSDALSRMGLRGIPRVSLTDSERLP